ncbi:uncharacterized protein K444DRAFT_610806 [Hyaloscypha bicolor E]|jgi:hypothetical protein|uniref:Uncharacterized protein n=1 Tax=Hyaloscypha bicolor E TaxID=1095630 RepID=A0A2J6TIE1_9HELO|nr:uncharacterized protein K444DRAFT_610806 [Hyaloscypha bicolor E]PMD62792.1 hypothetical protein K444DRAFT_610806 [Hyaloscypha bicolor E]
MAPLFFKFFGASRLELVSVLAFIALATLRCYEEQEQKSDAEVSKSFNAKPSLFRASAGIPASGSHVQATFFPHMGS